MGGINSTGSISHSVVLFGPHPTNVSALTSLPEGLGARWSTVLFPAPNGTFAWGGCTRIRDYPLVGTPDADLGNRSPVCFNDMWFRHHNGTVR